MSEQFVPPLTRRGLIGSAALAGLVMAGCGGSSDPKANVTNTVAVPPPGQRKKGGTFRLGTSQMNGATSADPQTSISAFLLARSMFSNLVERGHDFQIRPGLAEEFEPEGGDFSVWTIRLRDGIEFHDGKTLDVDDVIYTIKRNINPKTPGFTAGLMDAIDPKQMKKLDSRTLRLTLKYPNSQLRDGFVEIPSCILPAGFDPKKPVGTGPFKQQSLSPNRRWVGTRNENYWRGNGLPYLDQVVYIGFADQNSRVNALLSGQVDGIDTVLPSQVKQVQGRSTINVVMSETGSFEPIAMNSASGPLADPQARLALKLATDRQQLLNGVYAGLGELGNDTGVWKQFDRAYPELAQRQPDLDKARSLAKASGIAGKTLPMRLGETVPGIFATGEIFAEQMKQIGVNVKLNKFTDLAQFYGSEEYYTSPLKIDYDYTQTTYDNLSYCWLPGRTYNSTGYDNKQVNALYKDALKVDGAEYQQKIAEIAKIINEDGPWIVWGRRTIPDAITKKFTGLVPDASGTGYNGCYLEEISQT